jgi:hypothetical protein
MYASKAPLFTLRMFESITKDSSKLRTYRKELKKVHGRLVAEARHRASRSFIPATFDTMMLDFGNRVQRKELDDDYFNARQECLKKGIHRKSTAEIC